VVVAVVGLTTWVVVSSDETVAGPTSTSTGQPAPAGGASCTPEIAAGPAEVGQPAPELRLRGLDGGCVDLADLRGRPVIVNFWASWCFPCRQEMPLLRDGYAKYRDQGLEIVGIPYRDIDGDSRAFAEKYGATWLLAKDVDSAAANAYGVRPIPQSFFIRRDGTIAAHVRGMTTEDFNREVRKIVREDPTSTSTAVPGPTSSSGGNG
jgi:cytochrome c biogenesis protein CcmG, thiol:disulfide interchange protein DsbE